jgi:Ca2+-binding RTX toxin-like protein
LGAGKIEDNMSIIIPSSFKNPLILIPDHIVQNPLDPVVFGTPLLIDPVTNLRIDGVDVIDGGLADEAFHGWLIDEETTDTTDLLFGNGGNDFLYGDGGDDAVYGGTGNDYIEGGFGNDGGRILGVAADGSFVRFVDIQVAYSGTTFRTGLYGGSGNDIVYGGAGDDALFGEADNDLLFGEEDRDWLDGGDGNDELNGGDGNDILFGQNGSDLLLGDAGSDTMFGGIGADSLFGGAGVDRLVGGADADVMLGAEGRDELLGEGGDDILIGGAGVDALSGGGGADKYRLTAIEDLGDVIQNFTSADTIQLVKSITKLGKNLKKGTLTSKNFDSGTDNKADDKDDYFIFRKSDNTLWFDKDGDGAAFGSIKVLTLLNDYDLKPSDIVIL